MRFSLYFAIIAVINSSQLCSVTSAKVQSDASIPRTRIIFYHGNSSSIRQPYKLNKLRDVLVHPEFDPLRQTLLYLNDCYESFDESVEVIVNAYLKRGDHNILVLDWSSFNKDEYFEVIIPNIKRLSIEIADSIVAASGVGLNLQKLHLVGFSLGAQLAGSIGRAIREKLNRKLVRISGLDPSSSGFNEPTSNSNFLLPLSSLDAEFTDVIHTDAGFQGAESDSATADFWPNFGHRRQPGCGASNVYDKETSKNDLCSHKRAYQYWAESVVSDNKDTFLAVAAKNFTYFRNGELNLSQIASMGLNCSLNTLKGNYYLQTNEFPPYSRGVAGLIYSDPDGLKPNNKSP